METLLDKPSKIDLAKIVIGNIISKKTAALAMGLIYLGWIAHKPGEHSKLLILVGGCLVTVYMACDLAKQLLNKKKGQ